MKIKLLIIALLAGIAGYGQTGPISMETRPFGQKIFFDNEGLYHEGVSHNSDWMAPFIWAGLDSLYRRILILERKVDSLEKRPFLQLGQWPHLDTLPLIWDSASLRRYIQPSGTGVPYTGSTGFVCGGLVDSLFAIDSAVRFQTTPKKKKKK